MTYSLFVPTTNQGKNKIIWLIQVGQNVRYKLFMATSTEG
jgi:hypothetical protein